MPSKSRRVASKQASLKGKRRREKGAGQVFDAGPTEAQIAAREDEEESGPKPAPSTPPGAAAVAPAPARRSRRSRQAAAEGAPLSYPYLGVELRRIGIIAVAILVVLAAATFAIGG